jgi:hypothetical protein
MTCAVVICKERFSMTVGVAVAVAQGQFRNPEEEQCSLLVAWLLLPSNGMDASVYVQQGIV